MLARQVGAFGAAARGPVSSLRDVVTFTEITAPASVRRNSSEPATPKNAASTPTGNGEQARAQVLGGRTPPEAGGLPLNVTDDGERSILELILLGILVASFMALLVALYVSERRGRPLV